MKISTRRHIAEQMRIKGVSMSVDLIGRIIQLQNHTEIGCVERLPLSSEATIQYVAGLRIGPLDQAVNMRQMNRFNLFHALGAHIDTTVQAIRRFRQLIGLEEEAVRVRGGSYRFEGAQQLFLRHATTILTTNELRRNYMETRYEMLHSYFNFDDAWRLSTRFHALDENEEAEAGNAAPGQGGSQSDDGASPGFPLSDAFSRS